MNNELLTIQEMAAKSGLSESTMRRRIDALEIEPDCMRKNAHGSDTPCYSVSKFDTLQLDFKAIGANLIQMVQTPEGRQQITEGGITMQVAAGDIEKSVGGKLIADLRASNKALEEQVIEYQGIASAWKSQCEYRSSEVRRIPFMLEEIRGLEANLKYERSKVDALEEKIRSML